MCCPAAIPRPPVAMRTATRTPVVTPRVMPAKTKIMSILDRARIAMEESYGFEDSYEPTEVYEPYTSSAVSHSRSYSTHHYEPDYEPEYYRESSSSYGKSAFGILLKRNNHNLNTKMKLRN
jgi:KH domain-containing RNA-binding signal transduction-associated protein 3